MSNNIDGVGQQELHGLIHYDPSSGRIVRLYSHYPVSTKPRKTGYLMMRLMGRQLLQHRLAHLYMTGYVPAMIDHVNGIKTDNSWENLRACDKSDNACNANVGQKNKHGHRGIYFNNITGKFQGRVTVKGRSHHVGSFKELGDAVRSTELLRKELHGEFYYQ